MYNANVLASSFNNLDAYYQKNYGDGDLDERFYMELKKQGQHKCVPLTPFSKQGAANKLNISVSVVQGGGEEEAFQNPKRKAPAHRPLNYNSTEHVTLNSSLHEIVFISS